MDIVLAHVLLLLYLVKILQLHAEQLVLPDMLIIDYVLLFVQMVFGGIMVYVKVHVHQEQQLRIFPIYVLVIVIQEHSIKVVFVLQIVQTHMLIQILDFAVHLVL